MRYPSDLKKGYKIGVTATSAGFTEEADLNRLENGIRHFGEMGYPVITTPNVTKCQNGRSSDGRTRAKELHSLIKDPEIPVILAASGGDFLVEMLPYLDYEAISLNPKWLQGFSDTTGLTYTITTLLDIATIYSYNFSTFGMEHWHSSLSDNKKILEGMNIVQNSFDLYQDGYYKRITGLEGFVLEKEVYWRNRYPDGAAGKCEINISGRVLGGCLDVLLTLVGTRFDKTREFIERYRPDGILWVLESYDLGSEALFRGLWQLKEAGWFSHATGFLFGRPAMYPDESDISYEEAVLSVLGELKLPIIFDADIGHKPPQLTVIHGAVATVRSKAGKGSIIFERR